MAVSTRISFAQTGTIVQAKENKSPELLPPESMVPSVLYLLQVTNVD